MKSERTHVQSVVEEEDERDAVDTLRAEERHLQLEVEEVVTAVAIPIFLARLHTHTHVHIDCSAYPSNPQRHY